MAIIIFQEKGLPEFEGLHNVLETGNYPTLSEATSPKFPNIDKNPTINIDTLSSVKIPAGNYAEFFTTEGFRDGSFFLFQGDYRTLGSRDNKVDAIKVFDHDSEIFPLIEFFEKVGYEGFKQTLAGTGQVTNFNNPFVSQNAFSSVKVPQGVIVTLFSKINLEGHSVTLEPGDYPNLKIFGFDNAVSSLQIIQNDLEIINIEFLGPEKVKQGETIFLESLAQNSSSLEQKAILTIETAYEETFTRSFSSSTLFGLSVSKTVTVEVESGPVTGSVANSITATFEKTFTVGREESKSKTVAVSKSLNVSIPPNTIAKAVMAFTPQEMTVNARYTFRLKGTDRTTTQDVQIDIQTAALGTCVIEKFTPVGA